MEDAQIIELYWQRNEQAVEETEYKYGSYCRTVAYNILANREDARECVNDTLLRAWNTIPPQKPVCFSLFLAKITRNLAFDRYRAMQTKRRRHSRAEDAMEELAQCISPHNTEQEFMQSELSSTISRFLRSLPERECSIFLRRYFFVETPAEIAKRCSLKKSNVLVILSRTRKKLKEYLEKEAFIDEKGRII